MYATRRECSAVRAWLGERTMQAPLQRREEANRRFHLRLAAKRRAGRPNNN